MTTSDEAVDSMPSFLMPLVAQLRRRRLQVGISDVHALRSALRAGFGLSSTDDLRELCVTLWAKSPLEAQMVRAAFARVEEVPHWKVVAEVPEAVAAASGDDASVPGGRLGDGDDDDGADYESGIPEEAHTTEAVAAASGDDTSAPGGRLSYGDDGGNTSGIPEATQISPVRGLGTVQLRTGITDRGLLLIPQYPLTSREVAQAWRYLRRPIRSGPAVELDIGATITQRSHRGVATPPVVVPRRRNAVRLLLMIDRNGSMTPFHGYVDYVVASIRDAGRIDDVTAVYYHNLPGEHANRSVLDAMPDPFRPDLDQILPLIGPMRGGRVYNDPALTSPRSLDQVMDQANRAMAVLLIGDAGAARGRFDIVRLLDTVSLLKAVRASNAELAWLNPVPTQRWWRSTAGQIARYIPMFPFTRQGLDQAVDALRGRPAPVERPL